MGSAYSQAGAKWATQGNTTSTGDFIGTTDFKPLVFKTNNVIRGAFTETGSFQLNNLSGTGNRFLQTDASGNIIPFTMGTPSQVLYGNGTWGSLPTPPTTFWNASGSNIYYLGKVGIGTSTPLFPLDVIGDVRISNNLYVGGGIVITDKVNASTEVVTSRVKADSIVTDSTKGFYGTTKFNGNVKLQSKLSINGSATIAGPLKLLGGLTFGIVPPISIDPCIEMLAIGSDGTLVQMNASADLTFDPTIFSCPEPPIVPFTWQTWGNHVNHDARWIGTIENFDFRIKTNSTLRIVVKKDGKVGIGTNTPSELFEVNGNTKVTGNTLVTGSSIINGNVGIGTALTSNPNNYKLAVNGVIGAKEVKIEITSTTWPDFVFENNYKRMTLLEKEAFYLKEKHLPNIASKKEIEKNGLQVSTVLSGITQNVEENTIDIVELYKKVIALEKENEKLKKQIECFKK